jgi:hypothetical protein
MISSLATVFLWTKVKFGAPYRFTADGSFFIQSHSKQNATIL